MSRRLSKNPLSLALTLPPGAREGCRFRAARVLALVFSLVSHSAQSAEGVQAGLDSTCSDCQSEAVHLSSWALEESEPTEILTVSKLDERELGDEPLAVRSALPAQEASKPLSQNRHLVRVAAEPALGAVTLREVAGIDEEMVEQVAGTFRAILSNSSVPRAQRVLAIEPQVAVVKDESSLRLDGSKVYTVTAEGALAEVKATDDALPAEKLVSRPSRVEGNGWVVVAPGSVSSAALAPRPGHTASSSESLKSLLGSQPAPQGQSSLASSTSFLLPSLSGWASPGGTFASSATMAAPHMTPLRGETASSGPLVARVSKAPVQEESRGPVFEIAPEFEHGVRGFIGGPFQMGASASGSAAPSSEVRPTARGVVRGRVVTSAPVAPGSIWVRLAGTEFQLQTDRDGFFEFSSLPFQSKGELLVWDSEGRLTRRLVPVTAGDGTREYSISLERSEVIDALAKSFGDDQNMMQAGFCATVQAPSPLLLVGARVDVSSTAGALRPRFFTERGLPGRDAVELTENGRFCVFNVVSEMIDVSLALVNGTRRAFSVHLKPSVFESDLRFDLGESHYRPVATYELLDFDEMVSASSRSLIHTFASPGARSWYDGHVAPAWSRVANSHVRTDAAYSSVAVEQERSSEPLYFPMGQEMVEVAWGAEPNRSEGFALVSREELRGAMVSGNEMALRMLGASAVEEFAQATGQEVDASQGAAFVDIDLAAVGLDYFDTLLSVRDVWTGERVGRVHFLPVPRGASSPRHVRAFISGLAPGQHTLLLTDRNRAIKWLDVVRARPGQVQVISVESK